MRLLRQNPALIPGVVEEIVRCAPSVPRAWRIVKEAILMQGQLIKAGSLIFPILSAANRDPEYFPNPDTFDIQHENNPQLAFGYGIHFCLGRRLPA